MGMYILVHFKVKGNTVAMDITGTCMQMWMLSIL